jgi:hypothetical protein
MLVPRPLSLGIADTRCLRLSFPILPSWVMLPIVQSAPLLHRLDTALRSHPHLNRQNVFLESDPTHVVLRGTVDSFFRKQMVQEAIRKVDGITDVKIRNLIEVK